MHDQTVPAEDLAAEQIALAPYKEVIQRAEEAFARKQCFSLIRLGDGESAVLGYPEMVHSVRHARWMAHFFGARVVGLDQYARLRAGLEAAILGADVVGTHRVRFVDPLPAAARALSLGAQARLNLAEKEEINILERRLLSHLIAPHRSAGQTLTDTNVHIGMHQAGFLVNLIRRSRNVTLISGNPGLDRVLGNVFGGTSFDLTLVPSEYRWASDKAAQDKDVQHFPDVFDDVIGRIRAGALQYCVLVGAGPCGKIYCDEVRRAGGFALDVGSLMDLWCGRATRSYMKSLLAAPTKAG